jgi:hypothetical protein
MLHRRSFTELANLLGVSRAWLYTLKNQLPADQIPSTDNVQKWDELISQFRVEPRGEARVRLSPRVSQSTKRK